MGNWWKKGRIPLLCYGLALLLWLGWGMLCLMIDASWPEILLAPAAAEANELAPEPGGGYAILGGDPQLLFTGLDVQARRLVLQAEFSREPGELDVYYPDSQGRFSLTKRVWARPLADGVYEYQLPPGRYAALRLDLGTSGSGNSVLLHSITLNQAAPLATYLLPSGRALALLAALPALASCAICTIIEGARRLFAKPAGGEETKADGE